MSLLEHKIPPPLVGLLCAGAMWFLANQTPTLSFPSGVRARASAAVPILAVGLFVMLAGVISFRRARTTVNPLKPETATALVTSGIYRYTRNLRKTPSEHVQGSDQHGPGDQREVDQEREVFGLRPGAVRRSVKKLRTLGS